MKINRRCALFVLTTGFALMIWAIAGIDLPAQAAEAWCPTFQRLRAASTADDNFQSVKGDPDPTGTLSWLGRVTFPRGLTDCWMDQYPGVRRTIYACATETMTQVEAVSSFKGISEAVAACFPKSWAIDRQDPDGGFPTLTAGADVPELTLIVAPDEEATRAPARLSGEHYSVVLRFFFRGK